MMDIPDQPSANGTVRQVSNSPPRPPTSLPTLSGFEDFMESGGLPTPVNRSPDVPQAAPSPIVPPPAVTLPHMEPHPAPPESRTHISEPAAASVAGDSGSFLTGLFRRAASTLESTFETAKREVSSTEVFSSAQESIAEISNVFLPSSRTSSANDPNQMDSQMDSTNPDAPYPPKTMPLRTLKLNHTTGSEPLLLFVSGQARDIFIVTDTTIEAFEWSGAKLLQANMEDTWVAPDNATGEGSVNSPPRRSPMRATRVNSRSPVDVIRATAATYLPNTDEVLVAHADATLRIYSVRSGRMGVQVRASNRGPAPAVCLAPSAVNSGTVLVGCQNGNLILVSAAQLSSIAKLPPPEMCAIPLGAETNSAPVSCVVGVIDPAVNAGPSPNTPVSAAACVGYADGTVLMTRFDNPQYGVPFAAHADSVTGLVTLFDGAVIVSIGSEEDSSLCASMSDTGRCFLRRMLPYTPTSICRVPPAPVANGSPRWVCPSENVFIVGGEEGQVDIFRLVPLSWRNLEFRLVRRVSERSRGRRRAVLQTLYSPVDGVLLALVRSGEIRRWKLGQTDAFTLALPEPELRSHRFDGSNVVAALTGTASDGEETRLAVGEGVIAAQRVLATVLEDDVGIEEAGKDRLVEEFQKMQAEMQEMASQNDAELRRAKMRIARRFANGMQELPGSASAVEKRIGAAARRVAAFELNSAIRKHSERLGEIRTKTVAQLRVVLLLSLRGATGAPERVAMIRQAADDLVEIPVD